MYSHHSASKLPARTTFNAVYRQTQSGFVTKRLLVGPSTVPQLDRVTAPAAVDHSVWAGTHDGFVAVLCPYPARGRSIGTQHLDDLNNAVMCSDDAAVGRKPVTFAGVHDTVLLRL